MREVIKMTKEDEERLLGYVVNYEKNGFTCCKRCDLLNFDGVPKAPIYDDPHYGREVPYPECFECGQVIRPENVKKETQ